LKKQTNSNTMRLLVFLIFFFFVKNAAAEDGYRLWLRYDKISDDQILKTYQNALKGWRIEGRSPTLSAAGQELQTALDGLLGSHIPPVKSVSENGILVAGTPGGSPFIAGLGVEKRLENVGNEGFTIFTTQFQNKKITVIAANEDAGVLYGVFHYLRLLQTHQDIEKLDLVSAPKLQLRVLNHWDNLDRTVERGYAGFSIWNWHTLPEYIDARYTDYVRACASTGINGTVLTNVNANALVLRNDYLEKVKALADLFRPWGIRVYLTARFSASIELGGLKTADPLDPAVQQWWQDKIDEIYRLVPDFGGFVVKANSEGQPGPQNYGRSHADGANMLAAALEPHGGVVMWRAFVYSAEDADDRARQAYTEFVPMDGSFRKNVLIQVKNGPIDFQPREPIHPMFGAMPKTPLMMEFQITQEYLGQGTHLVYLGPMWKEVLDFDTHANGPGSTVARVIDGSLDGHALTGIAGVSNIGNDRNWTGYLFGQANWYAFGRLAWNPSLGSDEIADEWLRMTFSNDEKFVAPVKNLMLASHETCVNYMTPLGLHHIMATGHHYGPGPWIGDLSRPEWNPTYYHQAGSLGIGFDRTASGSNAVGQYFPPVRDLFASQKSCPEKFLLWFHHVGWGEKLASGKTLWEEICLHYHRGAADVTAMRQSWQSLKNYVDGERFRQVDMMLGIQEKEAKWWRDACISYFQSFSKMPLPAGLEKPAHSLEYYKSLSYPYAPGIRPGW
jgi:alpha-glucuronidase